MTSHLYALERYEAGGDEPADPGSLAGLVCTVRLPADDVVLALVEGPDADTVAALAAAAGWRVDRLTPAAWISRPATLEVLP